MVFSSFISSWNLSSLLHQFIAPSHHRYIIPSSTYLSNMSQNDGASNEEILMAACKDDNLDMLEEVLSADSSNFDINHTDGLGNSALHNAARCGSTGCLEILLYYDGIKVNVINRIEGDTPLHKAAAYSDPEIALEMVQILVNRGASADSRCKRVPVLPVSFLIFQNKMKQTAADIAPGNTHGAVKKFLEMAALSSLADLRDVPADDSDNSDDVASDDE
ncbi:hypothetical protein KVV02_005799 [Mortierella alpina]|uniref:Uncharacterized protein n=1 Tax=Mortierella alpina TaxID=64518 RepID=A0A9P8A8V6_MORAP|nr:hypothetical protein KVV02_005799 [Mortierella alpina]